VAFPDSAGTEEHDVLRPSDEGQCGQLLDLRLRSTGSEVEIVIFEALDRRQSGDLEQRLPDTLLFCRPLALERRLQEVGEAALGIGGALRQRWPLGLHRRQLQFPTERLDVFMLQVHAATSSNES